MNEILDNLYNLLMDLVNNSSIYGPLFACLLIFLESILPVLPLFVFITIIFIAYGSGMGFLISYLLTVLGCFFAFFLCRTFLKEIFQRKIRKKLGFNKLMQKIDTIKLTNLVVLLAIPFTPAFLINIAAALSEIDFKKYGIAVIIGKIFLVFFWGFIGTSLVESLKNPKIILVILLMLFIAYLLSKFVTRKLGIK